MKEVAIQEIAETTLSEEERAAVSEHKCPVVSATNAKILLFSLLNHG